MFCRDIDVCFVVILTYSSKCRKAWFFGPHRLKGPNKKNSRTFELMCITRNLSVIYQLYANVSSLSLYNLIMCHIVSFDFFPSLER